jgi:hypothetical protein
MLAKPSSLGIPLPRGWPSRIKTATVHVNLTTVPIGPGFSRDVAALLAASVLALACEITFQRKRRHLPVVALKRAA